MPVILASWGYPGVNISILIGFGTFARPTERLLVRIADILRKHPPFFRNAAVRLNPKEVQKPPKTNAYDEISHFTFGTRECVGRLTAV